MDAMGSPSPAQVVEAAGIQPPDLHDRAGGPLSTKPDNRGEPSRAGANDNGLRIGVNPVVDRHISSSASSSVHPKSSLPRIDTQISIKPSGLVGYLVS
jgi:hypothetical protein